MLPITAGPMIVGPITVAIWPIAGPTKVSPAPAQIWAVVPPVGPWPSTPVELLQGPDELVVPTGGR